MEYRELGRTGFRVSAISFGAWAIGGTWGTVDDAESLNALRRAVDLGVNFFDTADVYGDGRSERLLAELKRERKEEILIATKAGRRLDPHVSDGYMAANLTAFIDRSLLNLKTEALDLVQLRHPRGQECHSGRGEHLRPQFPATQPGDPPPGRTTIRRTNQAARSSILIVSSGSSFQWE